MSEDSNSVPGNRDSDAVDDGSAGSPPASGSSRGPTGNQNESQRNDGNSRKIEALEEKLKRQNTDIANLTKAVESLQCAYVQRMDATETRLKENADEIERLKQHLQEKDNEITELRSKVQLSEGELKRIESAQKGFQQMPKQTVCFSARVEPSLQEIGGATIVFRSVETNVGNGYNVSTGEFSAPVAGYYVFYSNIFSQGGKSIETTIQVNGVNKQSTYGAGGRSALPQGGSMLVTHLNAGGKVRVTKQGPWGNIQFYCNYHGSTFSGFLLSSD